MEKIKVLFLAANPRDTDKLQLDEEIRAIHEKIRASEYRDSLELVSAWAVTADDLLQKLNEHKPSVVHISGHGSMTSEIVLVGANGKSNLVTKRAIISLFTALKGNIRVVIFNTCYSQSLSQALSEVIDCTIGMNTSIGDKAAITFASSFYRAIGFGCSILNAFEQAKAALMLEGIHEDKTPELITKKGVDPSQIILIKDKAIGPSPSKLPSESAEVPLAYAKSFSTPCKYSRGKGADPYALLGGDCPACNGTGWITLPGRVDDYKTCGNCQGSGKDPYNLLGFGPCHICHGSGLVKVQ